MRPKARSTWKRRLILTVAGLALLGIAAVAAIPRLLSTPVGKAFVLSRVNRAIAPGRIEATSLRFSWAGPTLGRGVVLKSAEGKAIVSAPEVTWDRGIWRLLVGRPNYGTITLVGASCDVTRRDDGSIDLADALGLGASPAPAKPAAPAPASTRPIVTLKIAGGSLKLRSPELPEGMTAERFDLVVAQPAAPAARTIEAHLARPSGETLEIAGQLDPASDLTLSLKATAWPLDVAASGVRVRGQLDGEAALGTRDGLSASGSAKLSRVVATGTALRGDRVALDAIDGAWDVRRGPTGWSILRLNLDSPIASVKTDGPIPAPSGSPARLSGHVELAALAKQAPHALGLREGLTLRSGRAEAMVEVREDSGSQRAEVTATISGIEALAPGRPSPIVLNAPATLRASLATRGRAVRVESLGIVAPGLEASGSGDLDRGVKASGRFDLAALANQCRDLIDLRGIEPAGTGDLQAEYRRETAGYVAKVVVDARSLKLSREGAAPIAYDLAKLSVEVAGSADVTGLPLSWKAARMRLDATGLAATAAASPHPDGLAVSFAALQPWGEAGGHSEARAAILWAGSGFGIDDLVVTLVPDPQAPPVRFAAKGRCDLGEGLLILNPPSQAEAGSIVPAPGGLRVAGLGGATATTRIEGGLLGDVGALDRAWATSSRAEPYGLDGPIALAIRGDYHSDTDLLDLAEMVVSTRYGMAGLSGTIREVGDRRDADLSGGLTVEPKTLSDYFASAVAPDARLAARLRPFQIRGPLSGDVLRQIEVVAGLDLDGAEAAGMKLGPTPVVARLAGGRVAVEPIKATLNGGEVEIHSEVILEPDGGATVRLLPGTAIRDAVIDDELSKRLLAYAAPVLHDATQVRGLVSMALDGAALPVGGPASRQTSLAGSVHFQDVVFGPGPMLAEVLELVPLNRQPQVRLDETIRVAVANGRVFQEGLAIPVGRGEALGLEGSVGFDHTLALRALVPIPLEIPAIRGDANTDRASDLRVPVAIGGTFAHPRIDRRAMAKAIREEGRSVIRREAESGINDLIRKLGSDIRTPRRQ